MSQTQTDLQCTVCRMQKNELRPRKSKLIQGMQLFLCNDCLSNKREPRFAVILVGRRDGIEAIKPYITGRRYIGEEILVSDLL